MDDSQSLRRRDSIDAAGDGSLSRHKATPELIAELTRVATTVVCARDEVLFEQGEPVDSVYFVRAGEVELTIPITSTQAMGFRAAAGSLVGLPAAVSNEPYSMTAVAMEGTVLERISRDGFCKVLVAKPALSSVVLQILAEETRAARIAIVEMSSRHRRRGPRRRPGQPAPESGSPGPR
jgi:CRP-like cAMP-binding protein